MVTIWCVFNTDCNPIPSLVSWFIYRHAVVATQISKLSHVPLLFHPHSSIASMPTYSMASNMKYENSCLQQASTGNTYSCMLPPASVRGYDPLSLGSYSRASCPSVTGQPSHPSVQSLNGQFSQTVNGGSSPGLIGQPGLPVPHVPGATGHGASASDLSNVTSQSYWPRHQCS